MPRLPLYSSGLQIQTRILSSFVQHRSKHSMRNLYRPTSVIHDSHQRSADDGVKSNKIDSGCKSLRLMTDLGLIKSSSPGTYHLLPVALKSLEKLTIIVDQFMKGIKGQKVQLPTLTPTILWEQTGRLKECESELMKVTDRQSRQYLLSPTHEEAICDLLNGTIISHKQLPLRLYQITSKFRDEMRPRFGLLRGREFLMKDLYTFDKDIQSAKSTYEEVNAAYVALFDYIGVKWLKARGSGGTIGGDMTHEFHFISNAGEDQVLICNGCSEYFNREIVNQKDGGVHSNEERTLVCPTCHSQDLSSFPTIEVGHSFLLGTKYTKSLNTTFMNGSGKPEVMEMGCYGLGVSRILAAVIEVLSTNSEIRWPLPLAPYLVAIIPPKRGSKEEKIGEDLSVGLVNYFDKILPNDVLLDDRSEFTIGRRFTDLRLMGIPYVIVLGKRLTEKPSVVEVHDVYRGTVADLTTDEVFKYCYNLKSKWNLI